MPNKALEIVIPFLKRWEGCRLSAYADDGGRATIGWGHTGGVQMGTKWTQEQADAQLLEDLGRVMAQVRGVVQAPTTSNQLAALLSFTYNLGIANLARSGLLKALNMRKYKDAADQFMLWNHIGMYVSRGLTDRRKAEMELFMRPEDET